jgi:putative drug exporter of the RND superfamily
MTSVLERLGRFCVVRRRLVVLVWVAVVGVLAVAARVAGPELQDDLRLPGSDSQRVADLLAARFPAQAHGTDPVVLTAPAGALLADARYRRALGATVAALARDPDVGAAVSPLSRAGAAGGLLARGGGAGVIALRLRVSPTGLTTAGARRIVAATRPAGRAGLAVGVGGYVGQKASIPQARLSEVVGLGLAVVVLLLAFGSVAAMGVPLITAVAGLVGGLSAITLAGHAVAIGSVAPTLATMIGLGVGIDYALFVVTRHQAQRRAGMATGDSIVAAVATSGGAVVLAGAVMIAALLSLAVVRVPLVTTLGLVSALVVAVVVAAAVTLLPALLAIAGDRIDALRVPLGRRRGAAASDGWTRWARWVTTRPRWSAAAAVALLALLALPALGLALGQQDDGRLPADTQARRAYDGLTAAFGAGAAGPLLVGVDLSRAPARTLDEQVAARADALQQRAGERADAAVARLQAQGLPVGFARTFVLARALRAADAEVHAMRGRVARVRARLRQRAPGASRGELGALERGLDPRLQALRARLQRTAGVRAVTEPLANAAGTGAVLTVTSTTAPADPATARLVHRLRGDAIPKATKNSGMRAGVTGITAGYVDLADEIAVRLALAVAVVVAVSFVLLLVAFRSLLIPLTAAAMTLVSTAAALGVVTAVFDQIVSYVPLMMFVVLFGLSMDYEIFLMTRIREAWLRGGGDGDTTAVVVEGLASTGRVITSAALIMVGVFLAFVLDGDPTVRQFGLGLAVAVAIDATLVRCLLVPAVVTLLGPANWWVPRWLGRLLPGG